MDFNVVDQSADSSSEPKKAVMANEVPDSLILQPAPPGTQFVPPSYESVYCQVGECPPGIAQHAALLHIPDFDEWHLPSVPKLPDIQSNVENLFKLNEKNGGGGGAGDSDGAPPSGANTNNDDFDFDYASPNQ